jgi:hypothetical protein
MKGQQGVKKQGRKKQEDGEAQKQPLTARRNAECRIENAERSFLLLLQLGPGEIALVRQTAAPRE